MISNEVATDRRLSYGAAGLLIHLLSKPDNWTVSVAALARESQEGRDKIYKLLNELIELRYARRTPVRDDNGKMQGTDYEIFDAPLPENPEVDGADYPLPENPDTDLPDTDLPTLQSKEYTKKRSNKVTSGGARKRAPAKPGKSKINFDSWPNPPDNQILSDWLAVRKAKRAPLTQTAVNLMAKELRAAHNAGYSVDDCLGLCCKQGWQGFRFDWLQNHLRNHGGQPNGNGSSQPANPFTDETDWLNGAARERVIQATGGHQAGLAGGLPGPVGDWSGQEPVAAGADGGRHF
ncbi:helix-turn-helix domain-containing protein [Microbulbifer sp. 2304DJ12-6]|uniref:helix-turn-helix domain-containing protein n=1 Tax=Microbulbifer sp. 2304DJ12-6 TaxID=3233340 RepID=UPI0039B0D2CD